MFTPYFPNALISNTYNNIMHYECLNKPNFLIEIDLTNFSLAHFLVDPKCNHTAWPAGGRLVPQSSIVPTRPFYRGHKEPAEISEDRGPVGCTIRALCWRYHL